MSASSQLHKSKPLITALEARILLDGAAVATGVALAHDTDANGIESQGVITDTSDQAVPAALAPSQAEDLIEYVALQTSLESAHAQAMTLMRDYFADASIDSLFSMFHGNQTEPDQAWLDCAEQLLLDIQQGDLNLRIEFVAGDAFNGAYAAYASNGIDGDETIFINQDWWQAQTDVNEQARVLIEEYGHSIDFRLNQGNDTQGDEGELFAAEVMGVELNFLERARIAADNDHAILTLDGVDYAVQQASFGFINAYAVYTDGGFVADKESNRHHFIDQKLGVSVINDGSNNGSFSGNDINVTLEIGGNEYFGWVSRPIKEQGIVRGFYFWSDKDFVDFDTSTADGNTDGDRDVTDNFAFILVVDQAWFDALTAGSAINSVTNWASPANPTQTYSGGYYFVGSSSDRVDSAVNALIVPNSAPTPVSDSLTVAEDSGTTTVTAANGLLSNDTDPDNDVLTVTGFTVSGEAGTPVLETPFTISGVGDITINADGSYAFEPAENYSGSVPPITYAVSDGNGGTATATLSIIVTPVNDAPSGTDNTLTVREGVGYTFSAADFGFTDPDDSPANRFHSVIITTTPDSGILTLDGDAVIQGQEILAADFSKLVYTANGTNASFTFQVKDDGGTANGGVDTDPTPNTMTLNVIVGNRAPTGVADVNTIAEGTASVTGNVLDNDTDPDNDNLSVVAGLIQTGRYGSLTINADGSYTYVLDNNNPTVQALRLETDTLTETFDYTLSDGKLTDTSTLTITITGTNNAPVAVDDFNSLKEGALNNGNYGTVSGNVLDNDMDVDAGDSKEVVIGDSDTVTVGGAALTYTLEVSSPITSASYTVVQVDGSPWQGANGIPSGSANAVNVLLNGSTIFTSDGVTLFKAWREGSGQGDLVVNDPVTFYQYDLGTVFGAEGTTATFKIDEINPTVSPSTNITVTEGELNNISTGFVVNGTGIPDNTTVTAINGSVITLSNSVQITNTTLTFTDPNSSGQQTLQPVAGEMLKNGTHGYLILDQDGSYTYTLTSDAVNAGQTITETFSYTMRDAAGLTDTADLKIVVMGSGGTDPVANADSVSTDEDTTLNGNVLTNDTANGGILSVHSFNWNGQVGTLGQAMTIDGVGQLTLNSDGDYTFVPATNYSGTVPTVQYIASNGTGFSVSSLSISITAVNDAPTATADSAIAYEAGGYSNGTAGSNPIGNVLTNDSDIDGDSIRVDQVAGQAVTAGSNRTTNATTVTGTYGSLTIGADGSYQYEVNNSHADVQALNVGDSLTDTFSYRITDGSLTDTANLVITINGANDAPTVSVTNANVTVAEGESITLAGLAVADVDNDSLTLKVSADNGVLIFANLNGASVSAGANGSATVTLTGTKTQLNDALATLAYQGNANFSGEDSVRIEVQDSGGLTAQQLLSITVNPDDRPLEVEGTTVNEASPYAMFQVSGAAGQQVTLELAQTGSGAGHATAGLDYLPNLEYFDGTHWQSYNGSAVSIPAGGSTLLVRVAVLQDTLNEGAETFKLIASNKAGTEAEANSTIIDDGTGSIFLVGNNSFTPNQSGDTGYPTLDDDRTISVNTISVNEASPYAVFTINAAEGMGVKLALNSVTATVGTDTGSTLQYYNGSTWVNYTADSVVIMPAGGELLVRVAIVDDNVFEGQESFSLAVSNAVTERTVYGIANIYDDGTGIIFNDDGSENNAATKSDDRTIGIDSPTVNEASDIVVFTITGNPGQTVALELINSSSNGTVEGKANVDAAQTLKYWDGLDWVSYDSNADLPTFNADGKIFVSVDITDEQDDIFEGAETFELKATLAQQTFANDGTVTVNPITTKTATATATIFDDGTGVRFTGTFKDGSPTTSTENLDDDRPIANMPATFSGVNTGEVTEDSGVYTVTGKVTVTDLNPNEAAVIAQSNVAGLYGTFSIDAAGTWTYTADNAKLQPLSRTAETTESFTIASVDGTQSFVVITLNGIPEPVPEPPAATTPVPANINAPVNGLNTIIVPQAVSSVTGLAFITPNGEPFGLAVNVDAAPNRIAVPFSTPAADGLSVGEAVRTTETVSLPLIDAQAVNVASYGAVLADGTDLPSWVSVDSLTGAISVMPTAINESVVTIRVEARGVDGQVRAIQVTIDPNELLQDEVLSDTETPSEILSPISPEQVSVLPNYQSFEQLVKQAADVSDHYGEILVELAS